MKASIATQQRLQNLEACGFFLSLEWRGFFILKSPGFHATSYKYTASLMMSTGTYYKYIASLMMSTGTYYKYIASLMMSTSTYYKYIASLMMSTSTYYKYIASLMMSTSTYYKYIASLMMSTGTYYKYIASLMMSTGTYYKYIASLMMSTSTYYKYIASLMMSTSTYYKYIASLMMSTSTYYKYIASLMMPTSTYYKYIASLMMSGIQWCESKILMHTAVNIYRDREVIHVMSWGGGSGSFTNEATISPNKIPAGRHPAWTTMSYFWCMAPRRQQMAPAAKLVSKVQGYLSNLLAPSQGDTSQVVARLSCWCSLLRSPGSHYCVSVSPSCTHKSEKQSGGGNSLESTPDNYCHCIHYRKSVMLCTLRNYCFTWYTRELLLLYTLGNYCCCIH